VTEFLTRLRDSWHPENWRDLTVLIAVSGGADSVSLLCGLSELQKEGRAGNLIVAHFNHRLRSAADHDEQFVKQLAAQLRLPCEVGHASPPEGGTPTAPDGIEAAAREARYSFLLATAERLGARYVATAHTADDQAETILHRILRGTGLAGLSGIPRVRALSPAVTLIRPLLEFTREEVVQYLADRHQDFCLDESNEDPSYTRNRIRHALLPQLAAQYNPSVREALLRLGQLAGEAHEVIRAQATKLMEQTATIVSPEEVHIDLCPLQSQSAHLIRELLVKLWKHQAWPLQQMRHERWVEVAELILARDPAHASTLNLPGDIRAEKQAGQLKLTRLREVQ